MVKICFVIFIFLQLPIVFSEDSASNSSKTLHLFDIVNLFKQDRHLMDLLSQLKEQKSSDEEKEQDEKTVEDIYKSLPKSNDGRRIYFRLEQDSSINWSEYPMAINEILTTVGFVKMVPLQQEDTYGIFTLFKTSLGEIDIPWEEMMQFFVSYLENINETPDASVHTIKRNHPQLSEQEQLLLARFSRDLPHTYRHLTTFFLIEGIYIEPKIRQVHIRFKPIMDKISQHYPEDFASWERAQSIDSSFRLKSEEAGEIAMLYWDKEKMVFDFKATLPNQLPEKMTLTTNLEFSYAGVTVQIKNFDVDIALSNKKLFYLGANINKTPEKIEMSGFWSLFFSPTALKSFSIH